MNEFICITMEYTYDNSILSKGYILTPTLFVSHDFFQCSLTSVFFYIYIVV